MNFNPHSAILSLLLLVALCFSAPVAQAIPALPADSPTPALSPDPPDPAPTAQLPLANIDDNEIPVPSVAKRGPRVAVVDFETTTLDKDVIRAYSQALWARIDAMPDDALLPPAATRRWLIRHDLFPFTPYQTPVHPGRITTALRADYLLTGHINRIDGSFVLDLRVYSRRGNRFILKDVRIQRDGETALLESFSALNMQIQQAIQANEAELPANDHARLPEPPAVEKNTQAIQVQPIPLTPTPTPAPVFTPAATPRAETPAPEATPPPTRKTRRAAATPRPAPDSTPRPRRPTPTPAPAKTPTASVPDENPGPKATPAPISVPAPPPTPAPSPAARTTPAVPPLVSAADHARAQSLAAEAFQPGVDPAERLKKLTQAVQLAPTEPEYPTQLAMELCRQSKFAESVAVCNKALKAFPPSSTIETIHGVALQSLGRFAEAEQAQKHAIQLDPKNYWAAYNLALLLSQQKSDRAPAAWRNFITMAEGDPSQKEMVAQARQSLAALEGKK